MIYYIPLEHIDMRYTTHLDRDICKALDCNWVEYQRIYPDLKPTMIKKGSFLDAAFTTRFKSLQMDEIAKLYDYDIVKDGDTFWFSDLWFPGIEAIRYMDYFCKKKVKIKGLLHAGSFTDTDFVRDLERWAKGFEDIVFDIADEIFVGSQFIKDDVCRKRLLSPEKVKVTGFPLDYEELDKYHIAAGRRENIVIFNARNVDEKQPWLFDELSQRLRGKAEFVNTQKLNLSKPAYYDLIGRAKVVVSFALQENFGFGVLEAVHCGCVPVVPNRLVYPEQFERKYLYDCFEDCIDHVEYALDGRLERPLTKRFNPMEAWFA